MLPRLGGIEGVKVEVTSLPREEYRDDRYRRLGLPAAPAIMIDDEVVVQGVDIAEERLRELLAARLRQP
jgi:hypothetical protein